MILDQIEKIFVTIGDLVLNRTQITTKTDNFLLDEGSIKEGESKEVKSSKRRKFRLESRRSLNDKTKRYICSFCKRRYGVDLDESMEKKFLITEYLKVQSEKENVILDDSTN